MECGSVGVLEYCGKSEKHPRSGLEMLKARKNTHFIEDETKSILPAPY